ncbi:ABC transporter ATP-binding protein [Tautonia marina]|uniref:ABC transporter ATP-binding protein n=1 Tax=Tautonia marina TaxID=2653855 RepID=UPI00126049AF|nr:ABC transporter ATP-binding protein [Tautonia marina]
MAGSTADPALDLSDLLRRRPDGRSRRSSSSPTDAGRGTAATARQAARPVLEACDLIKRFGSITAVNGVSFQVGRGEAVALLGPNGAGKTTTISMISGLLRPDEGCVRFNGQPIRGETDPIKRTLGLVPQELALVEELSARENLRFFGALQGLGGSRLHQAMTDGLDLVGLTDRADSIVRTYSGGMKRRLNLAVALLHDPQVILLDEPTVGVDPQSRNAIFEGLERLKDRGKALIYTTHYMEEAERLCDRIVIIDRGQVIADGRVKDLSALLDRHARLRIELGNPGSGDWLDQFADVPGVVQARLEDHELILDVNDLKVSSAILQSLDALGLVVTHLESDRADLSTIFLNLTGRALRDS